MHSVGLPGERLLVSLFGQRYCYFNKYLPHRRIHACPIHVGQFIHP